MDKAGIEKWVKQGEGYQLEFKKYLPDPEKLLREAIAFANSNGGVILLGVDDDGIISGIKDPDEIIEVFSTSAKKFCRPLLEYELDLVSLTKKRSVLIISILKSKIKPLKFYPENGDTGFAFYRVRDKSISASKELVEILKFRGKARDIKIEIGEKEKILLNYLGEHRKITLTTFAKLAGISRQIASRTLVHLTSGNVIAIEPDEGEDFYRAVL